MTLSRYCLGLLLAAVTLLPVAIAAVSLRRALMPEWGGAPARLAEAVVGIVLIACLLELLGLVGLLDKAAVVLGAIVVGAGGHVLAGHLDPALPPPAPPAPRPGRWPSLLALAGGSLVVASWFTRIVPALEHGMTGADTVWYHLPQAAGFVQQGSITHVQFFETGAGTAFYPATAGLFHALGMIWLGNDFLSVVLNLGWLGLALLAAWCAGRPYGRGPECVLGLCLVLGTPIMVETQPGGAYNDLVGVALLLCAVALLLNAGPTGPAGSLAALAAALALGTKLTMAVPLVALAVGVVVAAPASRRVRTAAVWWGALLTLGMLWYWRNLVAFGNPVPAAHIHLGPVSLPSPPLTKLTFSVAHYIDTPGVIRGTFLPGLHQAYGPGWWALLALAAAGMVLALVAGSGRMQRVLGAVAIVSGLAGLVTPQGLGTESDPVFFKFNLRYPAPALALGLLLLPLVPRLRGARARALLLGAYGVLLLVTELDPAVWPTGLRDDVFAAAPSSGTALTAAAVGVVVLGAGLLAIAGRGRTGLRVAALVAALVLLLPGGYALAHRYMDDRYRDYGPMPSIARWASDARDQRIAIAGFFIQYPLYGDALSNRVDYLARHGPHGTFTPYRDCASWRRALNAGHYDYVVTTPFNYPGSLRGATLSGSVCLM